ncbi:AAA family ATPase [Pseudactinotalea suaedae]|uniref:AAA family ATPase n=1 Tax=Pseudactinotalea suaedae TaxID=1524924 RepID=UPI0012E1F562|nr:AAA family ATPase [Pseudactinotalea suaedae]
MIVWINGAFGGGKTHTAYELVRRTERTVLVDPEIAGFGLQRTLPAGLRCDFQDIAAWRAGVVEILDRVERSEKHIASVVPMTLVEPAYLEEIHGGLRALGHDVRHIALVASPETLRRRLRGRLEGLSGRESWAMQQIGRCVSALSDMDAHRVDNDRVGLDAVVEHVAQHAGLPLTKPPLPAWRGQLRRLRVAAAVIR